MEPPVVTRPLVDRAVARLGAGPLVAARPGIGWLLVEVAPAMLWVQVAGAVTLESFYLVSWLRVSGADDRQLAWLPFIGCAAVVLAPAVAWWRERAHDRARGRDHAETSRRFCVLAALTGRVLWLGVVAAPLAALATGLGVGWGLAGALACVFAAQLALFSSMGAFSAWTQQLVPPALRGRFIAWRNLFTLIVTTVATGALSLVVPRDLAGDDERWWLGGILVGATLVAIVGTPLLARSPAAPGPPANAAPRPRFTLSGRGAFLRLIGWNMAHGLALACTLPYLPVLMHDAGIDARDFAWGQSRATLPVQIAVTLVAGWMLPRVGSGAMLAIAHLALIATDASFLMLTAANRDWLFPLAMAASGAARGLIGIAVLGRIYEIAPPGDTRFHAAYYAAGALACVVGALALFPALGALEAAVGLSHAPAWYVVAAALAVRIVSAPLTWRR
ncbi:MAG TPA: hypothetical protein VEL07_04705 [Planctomycetota bacterium]|nr:hypothetical protein [Planctomycetota bacterium]